MKALYLEKRRQERDQAERDRQRQSDRTPSPDRRHVPHDHWEDRGYAPYEARSPSR